MDPAFHPVAIVAGEGSWLIDDGGNRYLDGNSSIWTNLHGHRHPRLDQAMRDQLGKIAHSSFLGLTHEPAARLSEELLAYLGESGTPPRLSRVFFSDDGSTAMEAGLKMIVQSFAQQGQPQRTEFISPEGAYHGDTVGAMSLGKSDLFHRHYQPLLFPSRRVMTPFCYRCRYNRSQPEMADARTYRKCDFECAAQAEEAITRAGDRLAAWVLEPRVQGAAGMIMHPEGYAKRTCTAARKIGARVFLDEVLTGFERTGFPLASQAEGVTADVVALAKGLSGGYLPLAATLATEEIFRAFDGPLENTFFHGHSYSANALGCAVARASLALLREPAEQERRKVLAQNLRQLSRAFWRHPRVGDVRQEGTILAVEIVADRTTRTPFPASERRGARVCQAAKEFGLLTRPVGDVLILMPPYSTSPEELEQMVTALRKALTKEIPS
ncbi:MAG: adenosylmethionine--8-amino-7-oxononanoate transaminase [Verrucomicrobia bacterium]|nr:adenosylmethionine--8-amino-7-oxononanoate transaminase [Verrucomicrobiota bacterium]